MLNFVFNWQKISTGFPLKIRDNRKLAIGKKTKASRHKAKTKKSIPSPVKKVKTIKRQLSFWN